MSVRWRALGASACAGMWLTLGSCAERTGREAFDADVVPLLETRCASTTCHGVAPDAEARGEKIDWSTLVFRVHADGTLADRDAAYATAKTRIDTLERAELSTLVRKPLGVESGGLHHAGGVVFRNRDDPALQILTAWIAGESGGSEGGRPESLTPAQRVFAERVLPALASRQCMNAGCHGAFAPFTAFEPPVPLDGKLVFGVDAIRKNHAAARMHLYAGADPARSRLVRKTTPIHDGGILHRGGNGIFFLGGRSDPVLQAIEDWAREERIEQLGSPSIPDVSGVVYVRGPTAPEGPFTHDRFNPGTDLFVLEPPVPGGARRNLTAAAHGDAPADVRDPTVSHDARRVAFAMRRTEDDAFNIYEIGVDGSDFRQLTHDGARLPGGGRAANVQPTYGPDGRVYFVSTRAGHAADGIAALDTEVWAVDRGSGVLERITHDPAPEVTPSFIGTGKSYGTLSFTVMRAIGGRYKGVAFRTPLDHNRAYHGDPELHIHHGATATGEAVYGMRATVDGRFVATFVDRGSVHRGGPLVIFDRQLGPAITPGLEAQTSEPGYKEAFTVLDPAPSTQGGSRGGALYRHPVPLPDGRVLVARAEGVDASDANAAPALALAALTLAEDPATGRPVVTGREALSTGDVPEYDAEPIVVRPLEDDPLHARAWDPAKATGTLAVRHAETLEAIFAGLEPRGPKNLRTDLVSARLVEAVPETPDELTAAPLGLGGHVPARILAEVPLAGGSLQLEVPANRAFRLQLLDADGMAVGAQQNRWIDVAPGQVFPGGVTPALYPTLCAGCHGSLSGAPVAVAPVPDVISLASVTLATHENLDPRRPRPTVRVGDEPIAIDFVRDVLPPLQRSCRGCHGGASPAGGLGFDAVRTARFDSAYEALLAEGEGSGGGRRYVDATGTSARRSYLVERVFGRELDAPRPLGRACVGVPPLSADERRTLVRWIEIGAPYRGSTR